MSDPVSFMQWWLLSLWQYSLQSSWEELAYWQRAFSPFNLSADKEKQCTKK